MKPKFRDVLDSVDDSELLKIKKDLENTKGFHLKQLVEHKLKLRNSSQEKVCSFCLNNVNPMKVDNFSLKFGPIGFEKQVEFCSVSCLNAYLENLKLSKKVFE